MDTTHLILQLWPLVLFLIAVAGCLFNENGELIYLTNSSARAQFNSMDEKIKKSEVKMSEYMTIENH